MEDKVKSLDKIISEDCRGDLKKARDLFKSVVQDILSSSEFRIENTVRNIGIKKPITKGEFNQAKQMLAENINMVELLKDNSEFISKTKQQGSLDMLLQKFNKSDEKYKNFIAQLVSLENYFDKSEGKEQKIKEVYDKITSSLKSKNENNMPFADSHMFGNIVMLNDNRNEFKSIALDLQGEVINSVDNLTKEQKDEINEWNNIFDILTKSKVWNPSKEVVWDTLSSLKSGSGFYIEVNWRDESIYSKLNDTQRNLLEKMENEAAVRALKKKCQEYIKSKTYGHEDDLFSILDAIAAVDLELCMRELDALIKSEETTEIDKENEENNNENKIIIVEENLDLKEKMIKDIKEQLKHRVRLLGFASSDADAFCDIIDKISTEPIGEFKKFVNDCQKQFDEYQKDCGFIPVVLAQTKNEEEKELLIEVVRKAQKLELDIIKYFYDEAKKQAKEILKQKEEDEKNKNNPKILAVEFVLDLMDNMDNMDNKNLNTEISKELRFLVNGTKQLDEKNDFGFENLQSIVESMGSNKNLLDQNSAKKFYDLLSKIDSDYCKIILEAINNLKKQEASFENSLENILNQQDKTLVSDFFAFAFDDKQSVDQKLKYTKKFLSVIVGQVFVNFENEFKDCKFLSLVFKPYFGEKISGANTTEELKPIIESVGSFLEDFCLSKDFETSLNLLINNMYKITTKDDLEGFLDSYASAFTFIAKDNKQYANRNLLVDLKDIFLDKNLDSKVAIENISLVVNLLTKLDENPSDVQEKDFEGLSRVLLAYAEKLIKNKITDRFPLLSETLKFQCKASTLNIFSLEDKHNLIKCMTGIAKGVFAQNDQFVDKNKNFLKNYFWSHATEIFKQKKEFTKAEAKEFYGFILDEGKGNNQYFKLLNSAIAKLGLHNQKYLVEILNQDDNFKNILTLKNGKEEEKEKAYKSILKSLVKQRLNQKNGFVSGAYLKYYEKQIHENKRADKLQNEIVTGVNSVLEDNFQPDRKILMEAQKKPLTSNIVNVAQGIKNNGDLLEFWKSFHKTEKNQTGKNEDEKNEPITTINSQPMDNEAYNKDVDDKYKLLNELSDIFIDLINNNKKINDLVLIDITKKFVSSLYQQNEETKDTRITEVLKEYYGSILKEISSLSIGAVTVVCRHSKEFCKLDGDLRIKLLKCIKNVKNNKPTNDDLVYINLSFYEIQKSNSAGISWYNYDPFRGVRLTIDANNNTNSSQTLSLFFKKYGNAYYKATDLDHQKCCRMQENQIKSVIKNIGKQAIQDPEDKKNFVGAVMFCLNKQIDILEFGYEKNCYKLIDAIKIECQGCWKKLIGELEAKGLISSQQKKEFNERIDNVCDLSGCIAVCEWILSALAAIFLIPLASKTIRKTLHSPFRVRLTRHLIKNANNGENGIFSMIYKMAGNNIPLQEGNQIENEKNENDLSS